MVDCRQVAGHTRMRGVGARRSQASIDADAVLSGMTDDIALDQELSLLSQEVLVADQATGSNDRRGGDLCVGDGQPTSLPSRAEEANHRFCGELIDAEFGDQVELHAAGVSAGGGEGAHGRPVHPAVEADGHAIAVR